MTIRNGDHMVIKREGKIITAKHEAYHEFEVIEQPKWEPLFDGSPGYWVRLKVVK